LTVLFADRFVYIHEPKTGGTFVTYALTQLHGGLTEVRPSGYVHPAIRRRFPTASFRLERRAASASATGTKYGPLCSWNDHGTCSEIPGPFRARQIFATMRNPLQKYVSGYLFAWWKRPEYLPLYRDAIPDFARRFSRFPDLSFQEYMELIHASWTVPGNRDLYSGTGIGFQTERFLHFYFRVPWLRRGSKHDISALVDRVDADYVKSNRYLEDMFSVRFLKTESLNEELCDFLLETGYDQADVEFVQTLRHVVPVGGADVELVDRATSHDWASFYTAELVEIVRSKDNLLFTLFPEFDVSAEKAESP
jgi:hypothetical protein